MCYTWSFRMWLHRSVLHVLWYVQGDNVIYLCIHKLSVVHVWVNLLLKRLWERKRNMYSLPYELYKLICKHIYK